jgi:hypothetical protein
MSKIIIKTVNTEDTYVKIVTLRIGIGKWNVRVMCNGITTVKENYKDASFIANKDTKWLCVSTEQCAVRAWI